ncbi:bifunctional enoyl-CoA hydratase/phosphate acetyltransferase [Sedimentibacter hydroxybenzoicus DSM 7310]|uniref:Bifunctional enoyl-CoA hydratase/phosphate acetyltransferase n=1 Tax=Sedimentibacter hydroxybenzoicus DSM 7310 TaxID=1123245 RepID=A0A974BJT1_SEDHY|nr:bifunctional enoyl-CoA hydratase/phosphate acetyltransferase [Sedimentibacter hydroxybenzoicus]NYB74478.1 bifunctional enoyl-CoA hydratase/phosphate acetyltransferase [Sedimentibacter hydroxybenzoicus DSM 7310]
MIKSLDDALHIVSKRPKKTIAVAQAADKDVLQVADIAIKKNLANFIFVGNKETITNMIEEGNYDLTDVEIIDAGNETLCAVKTVELVKKGMADMPMKGLLPTATFMKAVLDKERGLRSDKLVSQITVTDNISGTGLNFITDCAMNISPDLNTKKEILQNAVYLAKKMGFECPKVAVLTAVETVNQAMPETIDAAILSKMNERGQIKDCIVDGPFALDNAISAESAMHKGIKSVVAGNADILLVSDIRMGNVLHKAITYYADKRIGSVIIGTTVPLVMTSRSDSVEDKLISIALSSFLVE